MEQAPTRRRGKQACMRVIRDRSATWAGGIPVGRPFQGEGRWQKAIGNKRENAQPMVGVEPATYGLQNRCSAIELHRRNGFGLDSTNLAFAKLLLADPLKHERVRGERRMLRCGPPSQRMHSYDKSNCVAHFYSHINQLGGATRFGEGCHSGPSEFVRGPRPAARIAALGRWRLARGRGLRVLGHGGMF